MDHPKLDDDGAFAKAINNALVEGIVTEREMWYHFGVSVGTVERWKKGVTAPHPAMRKPVYDWLAKKREQHFKTRIKTKP